MINSRKSVNDDAASCRAPGVRRAVARRVHDLQLNSDPGVHADQAVARRLGRRYAELTPIVTTSTQLDEARGDLEAALEMIGEDPSFADEAEAVAAAGHRTGDQAGRAAHPAGPGRQQGRPGRGQGRRGRRGIGPVRRRPAADVPALRRTSRLEDRGAVGQRVRSRRLQGRHGGHQGAGASADGVWARLKFEGGVHRVQRVPVTESQGRIHTSAAGVLVAPEAEDVDVTHRPQRPADRRVPLVRPGRPVRQHHRLRGPDHPPARPASWCPARTRSRSCRTRNRRCASCGPGCWPRPGPPPTPPRPDARRSQVRTVDRSERVRTYNFPENRIADHRVGYKAYNLDAVLDGDLDAVLDALAQADRTERLATGTAGQRMSRAVAAVGDPGSATATLDAAGVPSPGVGRRGTGRAPARASPAHPARADAARRVVLGGGLPGAGRPPRAADPAAAPLGSVQFGRARI